MLAAAKPIAFLPTHDADRARSFYESTLRLRYLSDDGFALNFEAAGIALRIVRVGNFVPHPFTVFGWQVPDIDIAVAELASRGIEFLHFPGMEQNPAGVWSAPGGARVAWLKDPDGNTLSLSQQ